MFLLAIRPLLPTKMIESVKNTHKSVKNTQKIWWYQKNVVPLRQFYTKHVETLKTFETF